MARFLRGVAAIATPFFRTALLGALLVPSGTAFAQPVVEPQIEGNAPAAPVDDVRVPPGIWAESPFIGRVAEEFERRIVPVARPRNGFFVEFGNAITGAGFPSGGPGYRHNVFNGAGLFSAAATVSTRLYNTARARLEFSHLAHDRISVGTQSIYSDSVRVNYFGLGAGSDVDARTGYRLQALDTSAFIAGNLRPLAFTARVGSLAGVRVSDMAGFDVDYPNTRVLFSDQTAPGLTHQPSFLYTEFSVAADLRNEPGHPTRGGHYQLAWARYTDRDQGQDSFDRYELSATHYLSAGADNWILSLGAFSALSDTSENSRVPFYLKPSLGGRSTLRGYRDYRFHDDQMVMTSVESRWAVLKHLDVAVFGEVGRVGATLDDLLHTDLKRSVGAGVRYHSDRFMIGRADLAHSPEGWRVIFAMTEPLQRSTPSAGSTSMVPFVP